MKEQIIQVAIMVQPYSTYTYCIPAIYTKIPSFNIHALCGSRIIIPLGKRKSSIMGIITQTDPPPLDKSISVRPFYWILDIVPFFNLEYVTMVKELALRYAVSEGLIYTTILPSPMRSMRSTVRFFGDKPSVITLEEIPLLSENMLSSYVQLWSENQYAFIQGDAREFDVYSLAKDPPWNIKANANAQRKVLHALWEEGNLTKEEIKEKAGVGNYAVLKQLVADGYVDIEKTEELKESSCVMYTQGIASKNRKNNEESIYSLTEKKSSGDETLPPCTKEQHAVIQTLLSRFDNGGTTELLFGVTGSGKSRVYCELIEHCLKKGKHAILLAPEIALVQKLIHDIDLFFTDVPYYVYHGYQSPIYRKRLFEAMNTMAQPSILLGTRSALFVPMSNIGLLILDEEHDTSYKQDNGLFLYNAKDIAWHRAKTNNAMLLLGSATPDCKTLYSAKQGIIGEHILTTRATGVQMPTLEFVDMKEEKDTILSRRAMEALHTVLENGEQAIILLNRRGYAPHMYCTACNTVQQCPHCEVSLLYHKVMHVLRCSYCGYVQHFPKPCFHCGGMQYITLGIGTEKLQEELYALLPNEDNIIRLDRDIARSPKRIDAILQGFGRGEASIVVGTQMLAKGHNFPNVSLSLIVDADNGLHFPDYRAMERVFQLIVQTAGRAGRGKKQGNVIIQSYCVQNPCWEFILNNDYNALYEYEMEIRKKRLYPPFTHIAIIRLICTMSYEEAKQYIQSLIPYVRDSSKHSGAIILGPVPSPIAVIRGQYRYQMLVKASSWHTIRSIYAGLRNNVNNTKGIRITLDIDPASMM